MSGLPETIAGVDEKLARLAHLRHHFTPDRFPAIAAADSKRIDELLDWRNELAREGATS